MQFATVTGRATLCNRLWIPILLPVFLFWLAVPVHGQQTYVSRYDIFTGYTYLNSPHVNLAQNGGHIQAGVRPRTWYSLGFDYSIAVGNMTLVPSLLPNSLQQSLSAQLAKLAAAGLIPPGYSISVPTHARSQTFSIGPQLAFRHWSKITLFLRPDLGAIYETAKPNPTDPIATAIVKQLAPSGEKQDWTYFYGFGGGIDFLASKHFALRVQADFVRDHLFNDILKDARNTVRFSIGPCFNFGKNIKE